MHGFRALGIIISICGVEFLIVGCKAFRHKKFDRAYLSLALALSFLSVGAFILIINR